MQPDQQQRTPKVKWYLRPVMVIIAILSVGPFAVPLIWISPAFRRWHKILLTLITGILTVLLVKATADLYIILIREFRALAETLQ